MKPGSKIFLACLLAAGAFIITDCGCGTTRHLECYVVAHRYVPPYMETESYTDSDGQTRWRDSPAPTEPH